MDEVGLSGVRYRPELPGEEAEVRSVITAAFDEPVVADLADALRASSDGIEGLSFVAERAGQLIGHILFTRALLDAPRRLVEVLVLSPVVYSRVFWDLDCVGLRR